MPSPTIVGRLRDPQDLASTLAGLPVLALLGWWVFDDGGYAPADWLPGVPLLLVAAGLVLWAPVLRARRRVARAGQVALGAFALYTAFSYGSTTWAGDPAAALEGAHRCALFLAAMAVAVFAAPRPAVLRGAALAVAGIVGAAALVTLVRIAGAETGEGLLRDGRLHAPLGYSNASAALWMTGAGLGLVAASQRGTPALLRPVLLGLTTVELGLAVLTSSRGWLFTLPLVLLVLLALVPGRLRLVLATVVAGAALVPAVAALTEPFDAGGSRYDAVGAAAAFAALQDAVVPLALAGAAALLVGVLWVLVDRRFVPGAVLRRRLARGGLVLAALGAVGAVAGGLAIEPQPADRLDRAWEDFKADEVDAGSAGRRFSSTGSSRYDFWRVAVDLARKEPLKGIGQDNFEQPYVGRRAIDDVETRWVHSLPLRALTHTGVVGAALLAAALAALFASRLTVRRRPQEGEAVALALVPLVVWVVHGSIDWLWEYPVLSVAALGLAAGATTKTAPAGATQAVPGPPSRRRLVLAGTVVAGVLAAACVVSVAISYVVERDVTTAARTWPQDPAAAFARLTRADGRTASSRPAVVAGVIALRLGERDLARSAFVRAAEREPGDWFAPFQLGLIAAEQGRRADARARFADAARRNPKEPVLQAARRALRDGERFGFAEADRLLRERNRMRFGPP